MKLDKSDSKSGLQKAIRFNRTADAVMFALRLYDLDVVSLVKRLGVIGAEDVDGRLLGSIIDSGKEIINLNRQGKHDYGRLITACLVTELADSVKTKFCNYTSIGRERLKDKPLDSWEQKLTAFIDEENPIESAGFASLAAEKFGIKAVMEVLTIASYARGHLAIRCINGYDWMLRQAATRQCDIEILTGSAASSMSKFKKIEVAIGGGIEVENLDPIFFDIHSATGKQGLALAAHKLRISNDHLWRWQFFLQNRLVYPASLEHIELEKVLEPFVERWVRMPIDKARKGWEEAKPWVDGYIRYSLNKKYNQKMADK